MTEQIEDPALTFTRELREQIGNETGAQYKMSVLLKCVQSAIKAQGFAVVPVEPTEAMLEAGFDHHPKHFQAKHGRPPTPEEDMAEQWKAMIAAAGEG